MIDPNNPANTAVLTFSEEFSIFTTWNGTSGLDFAPGWHVAYNPNSLGFNAGDNDTWYINPTAPQTQIANPFSVNNGILTITAQPTDPAIAQYTSGFKYTAGQISTYNEFSQTYGYFEMRAKLPEGSGLGSAFWLLSKDLTHPPELDIMESIGRDPTAIFTTAHSGSATSTHTAVGSNANGPIYSNQSWSRVADVSKDFHTYGLNWQADRIAWYMDGVKLFEMDTPADMHKPMYLLAGVGVANNSWTGYASPTTTGQIQIDYLRVYSNGKTITGSSTNDRIIGSSGDDKLSGRAGSDVILARAGSDQLDGGSGDDRLDGGYGNDTLKGGAGRDAFVFASKANKTGNLDRISGFSVTDDSIHLDNRYFTKLGKKGSEAFPAKLDKRFFSVGDKAKDRNDYVIYDNKKGVLLYDPDGSDSKYGAIEFATVSKSLKITSADFFVI